MTAATTTSHRATVLITGATSPIARAVGRKFAQEGYAIILAGRDAGEIERSAADLRLRFNVPAVATTFDAEDFASHPAFFQQVLEHRHGSLGGVVVCHGFMAEQAEAQADLSLCKRMADVNYTSAISVLNWAADHFEATPGTSPFLAAVSSVAGDRGRPSNYLYGATKAALNTYLEGLGVRMSRTGASVLTIKPGFVDTPMTFGRPGTFLVASPEHVAEDVFSAIRAKKSTLYTPWFWRWIMLMIRCIPEFIFKRMKL